MAKLNLANITKWQNITNLIRSIAGRSRLVSKSKNVFSENQSSGSRKETPGEINISLVINYFYL